jgi:hypothetical protein
MTYSACAPVVIFIQRTKRMRHVILSSVAGLILSYVSILSTKWQDFLENKVIEHEIRFRWFSLRLLSERFPIVRRIQWDVIINVHRSSCKLHAILSDFKGIWIFSKYFRKILRHQYHENPYWELSYSIWSDGRTDRQTDRQEMENLIVAFRNFAKEPKYWRNLLMEENK